MAIAIETNKFDIEHRLDLGMPRPKLTGTVHALAEDDDDQFSEEDFDDDFDDDFEEDLDDDLKEFDDQIQNVPDNEDDDEDEEVGEPFEEEDDF